MSKRYLLLFLTFLALLGGLGVAPQVQAAGTLAGTSIQNQAYADYEDANGNRLDRVFSNTVTTVVSQVAGVDITPDTATKAVLPDTDVAFPANICNTGNGSDTINLSVSQDLSWTVHIYLDTDGDGVWDPGETTEVSDTGVLTADACYKVIVVARAPAGTVEGTTNDITLTGTSVFDGGISDAGVFTADVESAVFNISKSASPSDPKPGDIITYTVTGINSGTAVAYDILATDYIPANTTYIPESMKVGLIGGDYSSAYELDDANDGVDQNLGSATASGYYNSGENRVELEWSQCPPDGVFYFQVEVNSGVPAGTSIANSMTALYAHADGGPQDFSASSNTVTVTVANLAGVLLDPDRAGSGDPGDQIVYAFTSTNTGNATDTIDLTYTSDSGWTWVIWEDVDVDGTPGTDGDFILTDTDADGKVDTGPLNKNASVSLLAVATIPAGIPDKTVVNTIITGASNNDPSVTETETLTTTVTAPDLDISKEVSPTGNQPPGTELTYTITVTNNGTGTATNIVITDMVPNYTTYKTGSILTGFNVGTLTARSDAADSDGARHEGGAIIANTPSLGGAGGTFILRFTVTID